MDKALALFTRKVGPLQTWAWILITASVIGLYMFWSQGKGTAKGPMPPGTQDGTIDPVTGEFKSATSSERIDPVTGERYTSSYEASGNNMVSPGALGQWMGGPMPFSAGDVYVNLPPGYGGPAGPVGPPGPPGPPGTRPPVIIPPPPPPPPPPPAGPIYYTVKPGESLWTIARDFLRWKGFPASNTDIARHWRKIYAANRGIIGGNPDLIRPGQTFILPYP